MKRTLRFRMLAGAVTALVALGGYWLWNQQKSPAQDAAHGRPGGTATPVVAAQVARQDVPLYLSGIGTVQAFNTVTVASRVDGELVEILFKEGQDVAAGAVLARLDSRVLKAALDQALATKDKDMAQLEAARVDLARYQSLGNRVTGQSVDTQRATVRELEAAVKADQAAIDTARTQHSYATIIAPISGRVGLRQIDIGNIVRASDTTGLVVITQIEPIVVTFTLPQQSLRAIVDEMAKGTLAVEALDADDSSVIDEGRLETINNQIDQTTGTIKLKAVFPNARHHLWPGAFVNARLRLKVAEGGLVVPAPSIQRGPQGLYVYVVDKDSKAEMRAVTVAAYDGGRALIDKGLAEGEAVIVDGMARLQPGSMVKVAGGEARATRGTQDAPTAGQAQK